MQKSNKVTLEGKITIDGFYGEVWFIQMTDDGGYYYYSTKGYDSLEGGVIKDFGTAYNACKKSIKNSK